MKFLILSSILLLGCSSMKHSPTSKVIDIPKFMGTWYVMAGRFTGFETDVHNGVETYTWNEKKERIDIGFTYNQGSFDGKLKSLPQKGWIKNKTTNAHWKVRPFWPLLLDYLVLDVADDYSWTAVGVPSGKYLWIMARDKNIAKADVEKVINTIKASNYPVNDIVHVPHK